MKLEMKVVNLAKYGKQLTALGDKAGEALEQSLIAGLGYIEDTAKASINSGGKSGRVYYYSGTRKVGVFKTERISKHLKHRARIGTKVVKARKKHIASAPGQAPANFHSALVGSINHRVTLTTKDRAEGEVYAGKEYAPMLEFGTSKMSARPFFRPALDNNADKIFRTAGRIIGSMLKASNG